jgi:DNA-binding CsgD family transcriptional regulator
MHERAFLEAQTEAIAAIGEGVFPAKLLQLLKLLSGAEFCSAFEIDADGSLRFLFAAGQHPDIPGFAEAASHAYACTYWRKDRATRQTLAAQPARVQMVRQAWNGITDPDYRRACYERGGVVERLTLYAPGLRTLFASAYRTRDSGHSSPAQLEALEQNAAMIMTIVRKHIEVTRRTPFPVGAPAHEIARLLLADGGSLSAREAAVAAAMMLGKTQTEIAHETGVALSSVITYRRRAYRKLGVSNRRDLQTLLKSRSTVQPTRYDK